MKRKLWFFIHNAIAHPLLCTGTMWAERLHDYSYQQLEQAGNPVPQQQTEPLTFENANKSLKGIYDGPMRDAQNTKAQ